MKALDRHERLAVWLWILLAIVVWNGLYDLLLARSTQNYLFRAALYREGAGPEVDLTTAMDIAIRDALWISTLWAGIVILAGMVTIRLIRR
jgi:hypothetical protein